MKRVMTGLRDMDSVRRLVPIATKTPEANTTHLTVRQSCNIKSYMRQDARLSGALHALLHMAEQGRPMTSEELGHCMSTNPVVVRRTMAGLRDAGFVRSAKGHGGGWEIAADLSTVSLKNVYDALGAPTLLAIGVHLENPSCLVEQAVNRSLNGAFAEAEALLIDRLGTVTLAQLAEDFRAGMAEHRAHHKDHNHV